MLHISKITQEHPQQKDTMKVKNLELILSLIVAGDVATVVSAFVPQLHHTSARSAHIHISAVTSSSSSSRARSLRNIEYGKANTNTALAMSTLNQDATAPNELSLKRDASGIYQVENEEDHK